MYRRPPPSQRSAAWQTGALVVVFAFVFIYASWAFSLLKASPSTSGIVKAPATAPAGITQQAKQQDRQQLQSQKQLIEQQDISTIRSGSVDTKAVVKFAGRNEGTQLTASNAGATLMTCGLDGEWRQGRRGDDIDIFKPSIPFLQVLSAAASRHSLLATTSGEVWSMGHNDSKGGGGHGSPPIDNSGQLGRGGSNEPGRVEGLEGIFIIQVTAGRYHSVAIAADGKVYTWGLNDYGQLGRPAQLADGTTCTSGPTCFDGRPQAVHNFHGFKIMGGSSGRYNNLVVDDQGRLHTWGYDGCGSHEGALPPRDEMWKPRMVTGELAGKRVVAFDSGYVFWVAVTTDGEVYTCNTRDDGYAGTLKEKHKPNNMKELGREGNPYLPGQINWLIGKHIVAVAAGRQHGLAVSTEGYVYSWGGNNLVAGRDGSLDIPGLVEGDLKGRRMLYVAAGEYFSLAATENKVFGWGTNDYLSTGVGRGNPAQTLAGGKDRGPVPYPAIVKGWLGSEGDNAYKVVSLAAGYQHSFALVQKANGEPALLTGTPPKYAKAAAAPAKQQKEEQATSTSQPRITTSGSSGSSTGKRGYVAPEQWGSDPATSYLMQVKAPSYSVAEYWARHQPSSNKPAVVAASPDVFEFLPRQLDKKYRNPCWQGDSGALRCLPYFQILGVSKCGTTDLYHRLSKHPDMYESANKGPHFWDECQWPPKGACTVPPNGDFDGYIRLFDQAAKEIVKNPAGITGEASSNTFTAARGVYLRGATMDREDLNVTIADLIREAQPYQRQIVIFRDPVERYQSAFYYYRWWGKDDPPPGPEDFHKRAVAEMEQFRQCEKKKGLAYCVRHYHPQQLVKGMYAEFLPDWLRTWPRDQLLLLRNEDYKVSQKEHMQAVFRFLGMREPSDSQWEVILKMPTRNKQSDKYRKMLPETRQLLQEFYAPFNQRLAELLGDDRYLWQDGVQAS